MQKFIFRIKNFLKSDLFTTTFWNGIATAVKMGTGLISNKIIAVYLGPSGLALLGQFSNFMGMVTQFATGGFISGITKYIAEYTGEEQKQNSVLSTGFKSILITTFIATLFVFIAADYLCNSILHTPKYQNVFYIFSVTLILFTLNSFFLAVLNGFKEFKKIVYVNISSALVGLLITVLLVMKYGVYGALIGLVLSTTLIAFITFGFVYNSAWFSAKKLWQKFDFLMLKKLANFTLMNLVSIFSYLYIQLSIRTYIINNLSIEEAGYWQGIIKISDIYLSVIITTLSIYYMPRLSEIKDNIKLKEEIFKGYKFLLPLTIFISMLIYFLKGFIITTLFSKEFKPMESLFFFQLLGNVFKIASWLLSFLMVSKAMTKLFVITELLFNFGYFGLVYIFVNLIGLQGVVLAYLVNYILYLLYFVVVFRRILFIKRN